MTINFNPFDESAVIILKKLAQHFPVAIQLGFSELFPDIEASPQKQAVHIGTLAFLRHEGFIAHEVGSVSSFIITATGLALFNENISEHLQMRLNN